MKKIFLLSGFFCLCFYTGTFAQTNADATGTPVSASRDAVVTGSAVIENPDSTGTSTLPEKSAQGPLISAPADNKQPAGADKLSSGKKPD